MLDRIGAPDPKDRSLSMQPPCSPLSAGSACRQPLPPPIRARKSVIVVQIRSYTPSAGRIRHSALLRPTFAPNWGPSGPFRRPGLSAGSDDGSSACRSGRSSSASIVREDPPARDAVVRRRPRPREWISGEAIDHRARRRSGGGPDRRSRARGRGRAGHRVACRGARRRNRYVDHSPPVVVGTGAEIMLIRGEGRPGKRLRRELERLRRGAD